MFFNRIKDFWTKNSVKKSLSNVKHIGSKSLVKKIGIVFDESYYNEKATVVNELMQNGIHQNNIKILVFKERIKKEETFLYPVFSNKDFSWNATFNNEIVNQFVNENFDLLISYYDVEKTPLLQITNLSKAHFKVGFATIDKRLNHFIIDTKPENYKVFAKELLRYLKILNKL